MPEIAFEQQERRRHHRTQLQMQVQYVRLDPDGGDVVGNLETVDISRSGVGAISDRAFYPGQRALLCMPLTSMNGRRNVYATVVRCRQNNEGYKVGLRFDTAAISQWLGGSVEYAAA